MKLESEYSQLETIGKSSDSPMKLKPP